MDLRIILTLAFVAAASAAPLSSSQCARQCDGVQPFENQKTYQYSYSVETTTFVNDSSNIQDPPRDASVLKLTCNVEVVAQSSCEVFLRVKDVNVKERSSSGQEITSPKKNDIKNALQAHWLRFAFQDGVVKEVCPEDGEDKWTLNIKRGILSALQSPVPQIPQDVKQPMMNSETDVTGSCPVYLSSSLTGGIIKQKDFEGCKDRTRLMGAIQAVKLSPYAPLYNVMESGQECTHEIHMPFMVHSSRCFERHLVRPFSKHNTGVVTIVEQTLEFVAQRDGGSPPAGYMQDRITDIVFEHAEKTTQTDPQDAKNTLFSYCQSFTEDDKQPERPEYFSELIRLLNNIDDNGFQTVVQYVSDAASCRGRDEQLKKFFVDAIAMCESSACVNGMVGLLGQPDFVKPSVAELWISSLPFIQKPKSEMIPALMNMVKAEPVQPQVILAVSSLIHNFCTREDVDCSQDTNFRNALNYFENALDHDCSPSGEMTNNQRLKLIVSLKAIGNIGNIGDANYLSGTLTRCMQRTNDIDIRLAAIEAFRRLPCDEQERNELTNLYKNRVEDTELRIAAYLAMMQCANEGTLVVVVDTMENELDDQVGSFVVSHLKNLNETSDPQKQELKELLKESPAMRRFSRDIRKISQNYEMSWFNDKLMTGTTMESNVIFSENSFLPRSLSINATADIFGYAINVFEVGGRMEGMQHLLESFVGPTGYFKESDSTTILQGLMSYLNPQMPQTPVDQQQPRNKRNVDQNRMDNIINEFVPLEEEHKPMASMYMKVFGNEIGFMDYDAIMEKINEWKKTANFMQILSKLATEQTIDISRGSKMLKMSSCVPTIAGLPMSLTIDGNSVTQVTASGRLSILGMLMSPRSLDIEGSIKPSVAVELSTTMEIDAFHTRTGLNHVARLHSDTVLDGAIVVEDGNSLRVKMNVPEEKQTIIDVSSKIFRLHQQDKVEIAGNPETQYTQEVCSAELTAKYLGVRICTDMTFPTVFTRVGSPSILLSGPSDIKMTLTKVDPHLTSFELDLTKMVRKEMVNSEVVLTDIMRLMVGTPNTPVLRTYSVDYSYNRNEKRMILDLQTPFKSANIEANVIGEEMHKKLDINLRVNPSTATEKAFRLIAEQEIEKPSEGISRWIPRFEFTGPKGNNVQLTGSVITNSLQRRTDIDLQVLENSLPLVSLNGPITKTEGVKKSAYGIEMTVDGRYVQGKLTGQVNRNKDAYTITVDVQKKVGGQLVEVPWASTEIIYGTNREDTMFRLVNEVEFTDFPNWNYHFEVESRGEPLNHENTVKLCYRGKDCNTDTKVVFVQNNTATMTNNGEAIQAMRIRFNHPAQNKQYDMNQNFNFKPLQGFNWTCSLLDDNANTDLFTGEVKLNVERHQPIPKGNFRIEMGTPDRFFGMNQDWHMHESGRLDVVSTLRHSREKTTTITFAFAPSDSGSQSPADISLVNYRVFDVDLDVVLPDLREINIGGRLDRNRAQGMVDFDFTIDKFGVQNWVAINIDYRDTTDNTKWEHRASIDIQTPLATLQNKRLEGGVKRVNNVWTSDVMLTYNPNLPAVGVEVIFTNNTNEYDRHGQLDVIFTTVSHSLSLSGVGGYQQKANEKVCTLSATVNCRGLTEQGEGRTFGYELNYSDSTNESRIKHSIDTKGYAPNHEVKMETSFEWTPVTKNLVSSFDFKWLKDQQQGITVQVNVQNTSDATSQQRTTTMTVTLPQQNLVVNLNKQKREGYYGRTALVTLNNVEKLNTAFTYTKTLNGQETICNPNLSVIVNGKKVVWDAIVKRVNSQINYLESSITHNQDTDASLSILFDITPVTTSAAQGVDVTFSIVSKYIQGYDTTFQMTRMDSPLSTTIDITYTVDGTQKLTLNLGRTMELPPNMPATSLTMNNPKHVPMVMVLDVQLSFPDIQDDVFRNLAMNLRAQSPVSDKELTLQWGNKGQDQTITINQAQTVTSRNVGDVSVTVVHPFVLPLIYPTFSLGVDYHVGQPRSEVKFEITTADSKKRAIAVVYTDTSRTPSIDQLLEIILTRSDKDDIKIKGELAALTPQAIVDMTLTIEYSAIQDEHLILNTKLVNRSDVRYERRASELEFHVDHPVSNLEIDMFFSVNNDTKDLSVGLEGTVQTGTEQGAITLEASWDKRQKAYTIHHVRESLASARPLNKESYEVTLTGRFEDKSYGDYKIYELDMMNDYNGQRIPSFFKFDGRDKEIEYDVNFNPADRSDYWRFKAGYLNSSAIAAKIDTRRGVTHTVNASVLLFLQAPKVLYTQINWHPQWPQDLKDDIINRWETTVANFQQRETARLYRNQTLTKMVTQWETFKARNQDAPGKLLGLVGALSQKIEPAAVKWYMRSQGVKSKWAAITTDVKTAILPYIGQATTTLQACKAQLPLIGLKVATEAKTYFSNAKVALDGYKTECFLPIFGSMMMNVQQLNTSLRADIDMIKLQALTGVQEIRAKLNERKEALQLEWLAKGIQMVTWAKKVNETVYTAFSGRFEAMKNTMLRNPILVDFIKWGLLVNDLMPIQKWNESMRALYTEISTSDDVLAIMQFVGQMRQLGAQRRAAMDAYLAANPKKSWLKDYMLGALITWAENQQNYKLVKADIENGEIIVLIYLQEELRNLQEMPQSAKDRTLVELRNQLTIMAPLLQSQVRTQIMDPQLQELGIYEAANLLNKINNQQNLSADFMFKYTMDQYKSCYFGLAYFMDTLRKPLRHWVPPYKAKAMIAHNQHYMTFDRRFYEFAGRCTYVLAHDFVNGNFSIFVDYSSSQGDQTTKTLIVQQDQQVFTIYPNLTVTDGNRIKDLPLQSGNITIYRGSNFVKVVNAKGVAVKCTTPYNICKVYMSGWYYGQTAGLLGTYDYQAKNDFTLPNNQITDTIDRFTRNWEVSTSCSTTTNRAHKCTDVDPASEQNKMCKLAFLDISSPFRPMFDVVDPEPFYHMCVNDMCGLTTEAERKEKICEVYQAYLSQKRGFDIPMPEHCIKPCQTSSGQVISTKTPVKVENPVKEADVIFVVEEKRCAEGTIANTLHDIAIRMDTELRRNNITNNRFALAGFGGDGVHDLPHPHTIDGAFFNAATRFRLGVEALEFADDGNNDTLAAILMAANYPFRAGVSKNIILISCSDCQYKTTSYTTVANTLVERGIQFNILLDHSYSIKSKTEKKNKSSKERIYGFDDLAVYTAKMAGQPTLKGDQSLRKYISEPLNKCTLLAMETNGSVFNSNEITNKGFQEVFVLRMVKHSQPMPCQICRCVPNKQWVGESVCERCSAVTPTEALFQAFKSSMGGMLINPQSSPAYNIDGMPSWGKGKLRDRLQQRRQ